jgi:hypothetical protein
MEQIKITLKVAFYMALSKSLLEAAAIACTLYSSYTGIECCRFQDMIIYPLFYLGSVILAAAILIVVSQAVSPEGHDTGLPYQTGIKRIILTGLYLFNPLRLTRSVLKGSDLNALVDILSLHVLFCLAATCAFAICELRQWKDFTNSFFLKPEILFPAASLLTLLRLVLLCKNLCFSSKEEEASTEENWLNN